MGFLPPIAAISLASKGDVRALEGGVVSSSLVLVPSLIIGELLLGGRDRGDQNS